MVKYYYEKYAAKKNYSVTYTVAVGGSGGQSTISGNTSFIVNDEGSFSLTGSVSTAYSSSNMYAVRYEMSGTACYRWSFAISSSTGRPTGTEKHRMSSSFSHYSKDIFIENIIAEEGIYPNDGSHSDGYWYVRGAVANQEPIITVPSEPNGTLETKPSFKYTVTDADVEQTLTITEKIDGMVIRTINSVTSGTELTFTPSDLDWLKTRINTTVNVEITANDGNGGIKTVTYPITRTTPAIDLQLKTPFGTDVAANRILLSLEKSNPTGSNLIVEVCNNAFDTLPTWENATNLVNLGLPYPFQNKTKTATKWGVSFRIKLERGSAIGDVNISGIGGAFD